MHPPHPHSRRMEGQRSRASVAMRRRSAATPAPPAPPAPPAGCAAYPARRVAAALQRQHRGCATPPSRAAPCEQRPVRPPPRHAAAWRGTVVSPPGVPATPASRAPAVGAACVHGHASRPRRQARCDATAPQPPPACALPMMTSRAGQAAPPLLAPPPSPSTTSRPQPVYSAPGVAAHAVRSHAAAPPPATARARRSTHLTACVCAVPPRCAPRLSLLHAGAWQRQPRCATC